MIDFECFYCYTTRERRLEMLSDERKKIILAELQEKGVVTSQNLVLRLNASESTIRRDLSELESSGLLERIHGGARQLTQVEADPTMKEKTFKNVHNKMRIAVYASELIEDGDIIYLDAGTTTFEMISFIGEKNISVVTNSVFHANKLVDLGIPVVMIGGSIKSATKAAVGSAALQQLSRIYVDKAFMGMNGVDVRYGYTTPEVEEATIKQAAMTQANECFVLVDSSKWNVCCFAKVETLKQATIITDVCPSEILGKVSKQTQVLEVIG